MRFRVRGLCFLCGYLRRHEPNLKSMHRLLFRVVAPAVIYSVVLEPLLYLGLDGRLPSSLAAFAVRVHCNLFMYRSDDPIWFLFALVLWQLWGYMLMPLTPRARLVVAFLLAAGGGYHGINVFKMN